MYRFICIFVVLLVLTACGSSRPVVRTTKPTAQTTKTDPRKTKRPVATTSPTTQSPSRPVQIDPTPAPSSQADKPTIEVLEATTAVKVTTAMVMDYIEKYKEIAKKEMVDYGIPASITLGQGILESGAGTGPLSVQANNHFGIKCHKEWKGPSVSYDDDAVGECFRKYSDPFESFKDHSIFLVTRERYANLFRLDIADYKGWAKGLKAAGYATDPAYPTKLIGLIERYQLQRFDVEVLGASSITNTINSSATLPIKSDYTTEKQHVVAKGDTLYSISKKYSIPVEVLKSKNNLNDTALAIGQILRLE
ncbi:glucosaminidase domain-containing protein [Flavobacterium sp.]|jgi:flagellum-specific peptidoglycan hydrolase FlgJ|uniref:glucosaminidase domain-containing protein n=1 Tax=Flavobacterium sp. TaxID=239 RepID=UPI0022C4A1BD|nr:glucosaminidase domain-containing protein [Flavobacterium sp.]MCZ8144285.1 glucosaminidase domain-containing protein [Flavobacterium sp.]MCZ8367653.1 glucosaminidase domain-containing protein [Flavobacterium sp.]